MQHAKTWAYQGTMHEELYTVLRLADLSMLETAEFKPGGAPIDPGELKNYTYIHTIQSLQAWYVAYHM